MGILTLLSRCLGIIRESLLNMFLGSVGAVSDAFLTAYRLPNSLRKVFAEGALSAATVPTLVNIVQTKGKEPVNRLMSLLFLFFESIIFFICCFMVIKARWVIGLSSPGFSELQVQHAVPYLQILAPFIFFISTSALLAGALQSVRHFFVPAFSPALLNIVFIFSVLICITNSFPIEYLCVFILLGGFIQLMLHLIAYKRLGFSFWRIDKEAWQYFIKVLIKFLPCMVSMSIMEVGLFVDSRFASWLHEGSVSLIYYANRFMGIPLGVFAVSFSTVLLTHFSRVMMYAPKRLGFYLLEASKLVFWVSIPTALIMGYFSEKIFITLITKLTSLQAAEAAVILTVFLSGLFFFSLNKILLNIYYAKHNTWIPTLVSIGMIGVNIGLDFAFVNIFQAAGLALATVIAFAFQVVALILLLYKFFGVRLYIKQFFLFVYKFILQLFVIFTGMYGIYRLCDYLVRLLPETLRYLFLETIGFWVWVGPLAGLAFLLIFWTRKLFGVRVYFLD